MHGGGGEQKKGVNEKMFLHFVFEATQHYFPKKLMLIQVTQKKICCFFFFFFIKLSVFQDFYFLSENGRASLKVTHDYKINF